MRIVLQRVLRASVRWTEGDGDAGTPEGRSIGPGLAILVGAGPGSTSDQAIHLAEKTANLRLFPAPDDPRRRPNLSLLETRGQALVVSQFTLYADTSRGRRPSYLAAGDPGRARELCETFARALEHLGIPTERGSFGAHMVVSIENDGPVTLVLSTDDWATRL
jgi:D-tyrosyl-tRNA(Tyr) deacylase